MQLKPDDSWLLALAITLVGIGICYYLNRLHFTILALVAISSKRSKNEVLAKNEKINWSRAAISSDITARPQSSSRIHFPNSMFPEQSEADIERKFKPELR